MKSSKNTWSKAEIKTYLLLLCARADSKETVEEINLIQSRTDSTVFDKIYKEFNQDDEDTAIKKLEKAINAHIYNEMEIFSLRKEMFDVFKADRNYTVKERYLNQVLDLIIY